MNVENDKEVVARINWWEEKIKTIDELKENNKPDHLLLFEILDRNIEHSQGLERFDLVPWQTWRVNKEEYVEDKKTGDLLLKNKVREFEIDGFRHKIEISPVQIEDKKTGKIRSCYPGQDEWIVDKALRKMAVNGMALWDRKNMIVEFSLRELRKTLEEMGYIRYTDQVKKSLQVLASANITLTGGVLSLTGSIISIFKVEAGKDTYYQVQFNRLISQDVMEKSYRLFNNKTLGSLKKDALAQWIFLRISMRWKAAKVDEKQGTYSLWLHHIEDASPIEVSSKNDIHKRIIKALNYMQKEGEIEKWDTKSSSNKKVGKEIVDREYVLWPSEKFVMGMKKANHRNSIVSKVLPTNWRDPNEILSDKDCKGLIDKTRKQAEVIGIHLN